MDGSDPGASTLFVGGGVAGDLLRACDWSRSGLGPPATWPLSLRAYVRAMLNTRQATSIFWGAEYVNLYNDGFIPLLGEKHPRAMGLSAREVWSDAWPVVGELLQGVLTGGQAVLFNDMLVPIVRAGRLAEAWWTYSYSPLFGDDGAIAGILVIATETTAEVRGRKELEAAKSEADLARQELQGVFMQTPLPMALLKGPDHRFTLVNEPYRELVGGRDLDGRTLREVFSVSEVGYYLPYLDRVYATGEPILLQEAPLLLSDARGVVSERFIDVGYHPYRDPASGAQAGVLAIIHDVTDKVRTRVRESRLRETAEAASRAKDEFLAIVSHELRNPLGAILGWARTLRGVTDPARVAKGLAVIERNATAQATLINDILDVSRIVSGRLLLEPREIRVATVVQNAIESIRPALLAKRIRLVLDVEDEIQFVADAHRVQQVVWNLLSNAAKFTPEGGVVRVDVRRADDEVCIRVTDTGKGIAPEFLPLVFDRFRQADPSTTKRHGGLGLGLAIVRHLVELHGGRVEATSDGEGRGATFGVIFPARAAEPSAATGGTPLAATSARGDAHGAADTPSLQGVRVLVVDDLADARELVAMVLLDAGAYVIEASSAAEAMAALSATNATVLVSDIGMPIQDGYSLMRAVRANPATRSLPALALTAYARVEDREKARAAGFDDHAVKPVDPDDLVRRVAALARGR